MGRRVYVEVLVKFDTAGGITPLSITWEDGTVYDIDRILDVRRAACIQAGSTGIRYTIRVSGRETYLYFEDPKWFVEAKG